MTSFPAPSRYSPVAMGFHWALAFLIVIDFALAESFSRFNPGDALYFSWSYPAHMSVGMTVIILGLGRVAWRVTHTYPQVSTDANAVTRLLVRAAHALLYVFMVVAPVSGWVVLSVRKTPPVFAGSLHWPDIAWLSDLTRAQRTAIYQVFFPGHILWSYIGMGLVGLHTAAALFHHYGRRDDVLRRMLPTTGVGPAAGEGQS